jgi:gliding motility-associated-like protein
MKTKPRKCKLFFLIGLLIFSLCGYSQSTKTTYDFSTTATLSGYTGSWPWNTQADITIAGTAFRLTSGGNGSFTNVTSGGALNSKCLQKDGSGGDQFTLQRTDGQPFQFYGIWVKHQSMNSYYQWYSLPPWYTLTASSFSYQDNTARSSNTGNTLSTQTISAGTDGITTTSVQISFQAILYFLIDDIIVGPVPSSLSTITTQAVTGISVTTATGNGNITSLGSPSPTAYGVCWNTTGTPTISDSKSDKGSASTTGAFSTNMTSLIINTTYYVRAYATNTQGTSYGTQVSFTTASTPLETEFFEDETAGTTSFTNNSFSFNITGGKFEISTINGYGWSGTSADNFYVDNINHLLPIAGIVGSFKIQSATFIAKDLYVFPSIDGSNISNAGTVIIRGKLGGSTQFSQTLAGAAINTSFGVNNGYTLIDFGSNSTTTIDELEFELTGSLRYMQIDALRHHSTTAVNIAPTDIALSSSAINENVAANSTVGTPSSTDPDAGNTFIYTLVAGTGSTDNASFNISGSSLRITSSPDYETKNSYSVRVRTTDQGSLYYEKAFTLTINDVNEAPTDIALSASAINENVTANSTVGTLSSTDPDAANAFTYTLVSGTGNTDNPSFNISGSSLRITNIPDFETKSSYTVRLRTSDQGGLYFEKAFTITINDLAEAPIATTNSATSVTSTGATLNGNINANGISTTVTFEYGLTTGYGTTVTATPSPVTGSSATSVSKAITGLLAGNTYHYRVVSVNSAGTSYGADVSFTTLKQNQTITFGALPNKVVSDADFAPGATASSALTVSYASSNTAVATIVDGLIHIAGVGSSTITASQAGDANYNAATSVQQSLNISYAPPVLTCSDGNNQLIKNAAPIIVDPILTVTGSQNITGARVSIGSFQTGDVLAWNAGSLPSGVTGNFNTTIGVLTFSGTATAAQWQTLLRTVTIATTSGVTTQRVTSFTLGSSLPLDVNGHYYEFITSSGINWTDANTAANSKDLFGLQGYLATITGTAENDFISSKLGGNGWIGASDAAVEGIWRWVSGPEGLEAGGAGRNFYTGIYPTGAAVGSNYVHWYAGEPNNAGSENYAHFYASGVQKGFWNDFAVNNSSIAGYCVEYGGMPDDPTLQISGTKALDVKLDQTITFAAPATKTYGEADFASGATASSGLTLTLVSSDPAVATVSGLNIHIVKAGNCTITASQAGNGTYLAALSVSRILTINKAALTITAEDKTKVYDGGVYSPFTVTYNGFITGESATNLGGTLVYSGTATMAVNAGTNYVITPSELTSSNYDISFVAGKLDITKKALTITADANTKVYGEADPALTYQITSGALETGDAFSGSLTRASGEGVADYAITIGTVSAGANYNLSFVSADLSITQKAITITAETKIKVYGETDPDLNYQITAGALVGDDAFSGSLTRAPGESVATYAIAIGTVSSGANYNLSFISADLSITQKAITITADAKTKVYGETDPAFNYQITAGALVGDDAFSGSLTRAPGESVATYAIAIGTVSSGANYDLSFVSADLSITQKTITITADAKSKVYGEANPALTFQYSGWLNGDDSEDLTTKPSVSTTVSVTSPVDVYTGGITVSDGLDENYNFSYNAADFSVTKATLTVTADAKTKVYGEANPVLAFLYSGWVNGVETIDAAPSITTTVDGTTIVGTYTDAITLSGGLDNNYTFSFVAGAMNVTKAILTANAEPKTKVYGEANPVLTFLYSGWVNGDETIDVAPSITTTVDGTTIVGTYADAITFSGGLDNNYTFSYVSGALDVTKAILTATAEPKTKVYGEANPVLTFLYSGWVNGVETIDGAPSITTAVDLTTFVGEYTNAVTLSAGADNNYDFSYESADFIITKAILSVSADGKSREYGSDNPDLTISWSGFKNDEDISVLGERPVISTLAINSSNVGIYEISLTGGEDTNYDLNLVNGSLNIDKAPLVIIAEDKAKTYLEPIPELTFIWSGFVLGQNQDVIDVVPALETIADENSDAGTYDIIASGGVDGNYSFTYENGTLAIDKADQVITFEEIPAGLRMTQDHQLIAETTSGLPITFETSDPIIGSLYGSLMSVNKEGNLTITTSQPGNQNWNPAEDVSREIVTLPTFDNLNSLFTPNSDGMNDYWYIPDLEKYGRLQVTVYNRFGQKVYGSDGYKNDWDGTWNGYPLPSASYYYIMKSSTKGYIKGVVNLVR